MLGSAAASLWCADEAVLRAIAERLNASVAGVKARTEELLAQQAQHGQQAQQAAAEGQQQGQQQAGRAEEGRQEAGQGDAEALGEAVSLLRWAGSCAYYARCVWGALLDKYWLETKHDSWPTTGAGCSAGPATYPHTGSLANRPCLCSAALKPWRRSSTTCGAAAATPLAAPSTAAPQCGQCWVG